MAGVIAPSPVDDKGQPSAEQFDVFISYSHAADGHLAPALQSGLQTLGKPWYRRRALRVFRDKTSLSATPHLWTTIESALDGSRYFILLASPRAADSEWVQRELAWWRTHRNSRTLLIGLTDGDIRWNPATRDFDWATTTALPKALAGFFDDEPLWVDLRQARDDQHLSLRDPRFRENVAELAAPLHAVGKDELIGEDVVQHRRTMQTARAAVAILVVLAVAATVAGIVAVRQAAETARQRDLAEAQARVATSRALAAEASARRGGELDLALLLAVQANGVEPTVQAREALLGTLTARTEVVDYLRHHVAPVSGLAFSPDGRLLASADRTGDVVLWHVPEGRSSGTVVDLPEEFLKGLAFSPAADLLAVAGAALTLVDPEAGTTVGTLDIGNMTIDALAFDQDGTHLAAVGCALVDNFCSTGLLKVWDVPSRRLMQDLVLDPELGLSAVTFDPAGDVVATGGAGGDVILVALHGATAPVRLPHHHPDEVEALAFTDDGDRLVSASGSATPVPDGPSGPATPTVVTWDLGARAVLRSQELPLISQGGVAVTIALGPGGESVFTVGDHHQPWLHDTAGNPLHDGPLIGHGSTVWSAAFSPDGGLLATGEENGTILLWRTAESGSSAGRLVQRRGVPGTVASAVAVSSDAATVAVGDWDGVTLLDATTLTERVRVDADAFHGASDLAFGADDRVLAVGSTDGEDNGLGSIAAGTAQAEVLLLDAATGRPRRDPVTFPGHLYDVAFQPGTDSLAVALLPENASADDVGRVVFLDADTGTFDGELPGEFESVREIAFSHDGALLATGHPGGVVRVWRAGDRQLEATLTSADRADVTTVAFDPSGRRLALGTRQFAIIQGDDGTTTYPEAEQTVEVWELSSEPQRVQQLAGHPGRDTTSVAFSPDGEVLAVGGGFLSGSPDGPLGLWSVDTGEPVVSPRNLVSEVTGIAVATAAPGFLVAAGDANGVVLTQLDVEVWIEAACDLAGRDLTDEEWMTFVGTELRRSTC
ncbi:TIR domain-containing protein [Blastococcus sp. PRF04-17]|uniref:TIR domain-containing protein n=1 Tax=Blastococcus sp. PRF04-17 TaxID=2933797 RepID=UPI001FF4267E|nr:TIR domain-containing protein [Blastococcus sp. PRF04-17]UOY00194.1 TIR domain-containing protein [Blastococcus sp. PRF04-17]